VATRAQTAQHKKAFLEVFRRLGNVSAAATESEISRRVVYDWLDKDLKFAAAFREAEIEAVDYMEREAWRRAVEGTKKPVFQGGELVGHVQEYSDTLMIFLLKARDPAKYREKHQHELSGPDGAPFVFTIQIDRRDDADNSDSA